MLVRSAGPDVPMKEPRVFMDRKIIDALSHEATSRSSARDHYETAGLTLLNEIDEVLLAGGFPRFVAWTTSRIGAFYLPNHYSGEDEVRLLHKHFTGATDLRKRDGSNHYWPLPLNVANEVATAELISIEAGPNADRARIEKAVRSSRLKCQSAGKRGSDSLLMKFERRLVLVSQRNQHDAASPTSIDPGPSRV
jgi:hypothetical protein